MMATAVAEPQGSPLVFFARTARVVALEEVRRVAVAAEMEVDVLATTVLDDDHTAGDVPYVVLWIDGAVPGQVAKTRVRPHPSPSPRDGMAYAPLDQVPHPLYRRIP